MMFPLSTHGPARSSRRFAPATVRGVLPYRKQAGLERGIMTFAHNHIARSIGVLAVIGMSGLACRDAPARPMGGVTEQTAAENTHARDGSAPVLPRPVPEDQQRAIGQRVSLTVRGHDIANDVAFWAEANGSPILVVMSRDV